MKIGIDIDETLTDTEKSLIEVSKKYNIVLKKKYSDPWTENDLKMFSKYFAEINLNAKLKDGAKEVLDELYKRGHELIIITARSGRHEKRIPEITTNFIKENGLKISQIYFNHFEKSELAKELGIDLMIDDNLEVYNSMKEKNIDCILFGDKIKTWKEVLEYINRKEQDNG